jgi:hypothetical protein
MLFTIETVACLGVCGLASSGGFINDNVSVAQMDH